MPFRKRDSTLPSSGSGDARFGGAPTVAPSLPEDEAPPSARPPSTPDPVPSSGTVMEYYARFEERSQLGQGGMNRVIRAFDRSLRREVAIKSLLPELARDRQEAARFADEARITGQLEHPYVVPVYDLGFDAAKGRYLCMRLVEGRTLEETVEQLGIGRLKPDRLADLLQVFLKMCEAVAFAHSKNIIHRDLKPSNVMISDFGQVYVLDWGVARRLPSQAGPQSAVNGPSAQPASLGDPDATEAEPDPEGFLVGTLSYAAPEQAWGLHSEVGTHSDVFSLGAVLYFILCGRPPRIPEHGHIIVMSQTTRSAIPLPDEVVRGAFVPSELSRIAMKAMSDDPRQRHGSVDELRAEVERFLRGSWHLPRVHFPAGSMIITEGEVGEAAYIIVEGRCVAFRVEGDSEIELRQMEPGEVFGETAILSDKPRSASVRAATDVVAMVVTAETLSNALGLNDWIGTFVRALANRFRDVDERLRQVEREERRRSIRP